MISENRRPLAFSSVYMSGAEIVAFDPIAMENTKRQLGTDQTSYAEDMYSAVEGADVLVLCTDGHV